MSCLVAFELKVRKFEPADIGQLSFYVEALDRDVKKPHERASIGVLLCAAKDNEVVEYALARTSSPTAMSRSLLKLEWRLLGDHYAAYVRDAMVANAFVILHRAEEPGRALARDESAWRRRRSPLRRHSRAGTSNARFPVLGRDLSPVPTLP